MSTLSSQSQRRERETSEETGESGNEQEMSVRIQRIRDKVQKFVHVTRDEIGAASKAESDLLLSGLDHIKADEKDVSGWEAYVEGEMQQQEQSARRLYGSLLHKLEDAVMKGLIDEAGRKRWIARFRDPTATYKMKEYFVDHQMPKYIENWRGLAAEHKKVLGDPAFATLTVHDVPKLAALRSTSAFRALKYEERANLVAMAKAALRTHGPETEKMYAKAKAMLGDAASEGIMSKHKVGVWLDRIFGSKADTKKIKAFVEGSSSQSLGALIKAWHGVAYRYYKVRTQMQDSDKMGLKSQIITTEKFLGMNYAQRLSYVAEAERSLTASLNTEKENPDLLRIRHYLDIGDWEEAEEAIGDAQKQELPEEDRSRLQAMRQYLVRHRTDGRALGQKDKLDVESIRSGRAKLDGILTGGLMDETMRKLAIKLLPYGAKAMNNLRWTVYNRIWCEKNGYLNDEKVQDGYTKNRDISIERARQGLDPGKHDPIETAESELIRKDEDQKTSKVRATIQYVNLKDDGVLSRLSQWYREREPQVLYWTTFVGHDSGRTLGIDWHQQQFVQLCEIRSALRTLEAAGVRYRGPGEELEHLN